MTAGFCCNAGLMCTFAHAMTSCHLSLCVKEAPLSCAAICICLCCLLLYGGQRSPNLQFTWLQRRVGAQFMTIAYFATTNVLYFYDGRRWRTRDVNALGERGICVVLGPNCRVGSHTAGGVATSAVQCAVRSAQCAVRSAQCKLLYVAARPWH